MARWPDVVMTLTEHEEAGCATAEFSLRNFAPVVPFVARWNYPTWTRDDSIDPALLKKTGGKPVQFPLSAMLAKLKDGMSKKEWAEATGYAESTWRRKLAEAMDGGKVRCTSGRFYHVAA